MQRPAYCLAALVCLAASQTIRVLCPALGPGQACLRVGLSYSATGEYSSESGGMIQGYQLWINRLNARGGVRNEFHGLVYFFSLIAHNDASSALQCGRNYRTLIDVDNVNVLFGPYGSPLSAVAIKEANNTYMRNGTGSWDPRLLLAASTADNENFQPTNNGFVLGINALATQYAESGLAALCGKGARNVFVMYRSDSTLTVNMFAGAERFITLLHMNLVGEGAFSGVPDSSTIQTLWSKAASASPPADSVFILGNRGDAVAFVSGVGSRSFNNILVSSGVTEPHFISTVGPNAVGVLSPAQWDVSLPYSDPFWGTSKQFAETYRAAYGVPPTANAAQTAAAGYLLQSAISRAVSTTQRALAHLLGHTNMTTFYGPVLYDTPTGENVAHRCVTLQGVCSDGAIGTPVVSPPDLATAPVQYPLFKQNCHQILLFGSPAPATTAYFSFNTSTDCRTFAADIVRNTDCSTTPFSCSAPDFNLVFDEECPIPMGLVASVKYPFKMVVGTIETDRACEKVGLDGIFCFDAAKYNIFINHNNMDSCLADYADVTVLHAVVGQFCRQRLSLLVTQSPQPPNDSGMIKTLLGLRFNNVTVVARIPGPFPPPY